MAALVLTDHAVRVRATRSGAMCSSRYVATTGLNTAQQVTSPNWTTITSTIPGSPGWTNASQKGQHTRSAPAARSTARCPNRGTSRRASRAPMRPPTQGSANTSPYRHGVNPRRPRRRTARSGSVAITRPLKKTTLRNSRRSGRWARMSRHPSSRSAGRSRVAAPRRAAPVPPIARTNTADSR